MVSPPRPGLLLEAVAQVGHMTSHVEFLRSPWQTSGYPINAFLYEIPIDFG